MVSEELPSPRLRFRGDSEKAKDVGPFAKHLRPPDEIAEKAVQTHHATRDVVALAAQARAQDRQDRLLDRRSYLIEPKPMMLNIEFGILPMPPEFGVDRKAHGVALRRQYYSEQKLDRFNHRRRRSVLRLKRKQSRRDVPIRSHPRKRRRRQFCPRPEQPLRARILQARFGVRSGGRTCNIAVPRCGDERPIIAVAHVIRVA